MIFVQKFFLSQIRVLITWLLLQFHLMFNNKKIMKRKPLSVNYHFTRKCNYSCGFCFHTELNSHVESLENAKKGMKMLKESGMKKINFAGGEPFLNPQMLGEMVKFCKEELDLESVSIVTNGSKIKETWFKKYGKYVDIMAVSCDSFDEETNIKIGRGKGNHIKSVRDVRKWCQHYNVKFKINTVVNSFNWKEDMNPTIKELSPFRWKVFQVLKLEGENSGENAIRNVDKFLISSEEFNDFTQRHKHNPCFVPEDNTKMKNSYLILDEYLRFLNCQNGFKVPSKSLLEVGVEKALEESGFDEEMFEKRGGLYDWKKEVLDLGCTNSKLDW